MIGRRQEIKRMQALLDSNRAEFLAVTGRRRVGKTYLIDSIYQDYYCFSMTGIQNGGTQAQLINFGVKLTEYSGNTGEKTPENWQQAFIQLKNYLRQLKSSQKYVLFIDELPWVATPRSGFIQMLAHFWNDYLSKTNHFILVICGSATSWITRKVINDKGGLHNRITEILHLQPFNLSETKAFFEAKHLILSDQEIARLYMALGGIPFYLDNVRKGESFATTIERICFSPSGILKNEYRNLYNALFKNSEHHEAIVNALSETPNGTTNKQLATKAKLPAGGTYKRTIEELVASGFVTEYVPFGKKKRDLVYKLTDEYSIFYHRFIKPVKTYTLGIWQQISNSQSYRIWAGHAFETLCQKHIDQIKRALGISGVYTEVYNLNVPGTDERDGFQIDLIIDRKDDTINLCEMKFHASLFTIDKSYYYQLLEKRQQFIAYTNTKKQVFITMITNHGVAKNKYALEVVDAQVTLEALFEDALNPFFAS